VPRARRARDVRQAGVAASNIRDWIAEARIDLEMARLLVLKTAWLMDTVGNRHARTEIAAIKVAVPNIAIKIVDRAIQVHGGGGVSGDFPLAAMYAGLRTLRLADGPDEVHKLSIARRELRAHRSGGGRVRRSGRRTVAPPSRQPANALGRGILVCKYPPGWPSSSKPSGAVAGPRPRCRCTTLCATRSCAPSCPRAPACRRTTSPPSSASAARPSARRSPGSATTGS
jgi:hypothetical protein